VEVVEDLVLFMVTNETPVKGWPSAVEMAWNGRLLAAVSGMDVAAAAVEAIGALTMLPPSIFPG
jgi:hypothetical protein